MHYRARLALGKDSARSLDRGLSQAGSGRAKLPLGTPHLRRSLSAPGGPPARLECPGIEQPRPREGSLWPPHPPLTAACWRTRVPAAQAAHKPTSNTAIISKQPRVINLGDPVAPSRLLLPPSPLTTRPVNAEITTKLCRFSTLRCRI